MDNRFELDKNRLDEEWQGQPGLYHTTAHQLADAREVYEKAKAATKVAKSEASLKVRTTDPSFYGLSKYTEDSIDAVVTIDKSHQAAIATEIAAMHLVECLEADVHTLDHRKRALEKLVDLRLSDYWSDPRLPKRVEKAASENDKLFKKK